MALIGDARPYNTALMVLDVETAGAFAQQNGLSDSSAEALSTHPGVVAAVKTAVERGNQRLARVEQIKRFLILPTYWEAGSDETTPTMKLKRKVIATKYAKEIENLYRDHLHNDVHEP